LRKLLLLLAAWTLNASAQAPEIAPDASTPAAPPVQAEAPARPSFVVPEPTSGLPPGRLIPLPKMTDAQLRELASDLASHIEITGGYQRVPRAEYAGMSAFPPAVTADAMIVRQGGNFRDVVRFGHVTPPRRLPQLWVQGYRMRGTTIEPNPDANAANVDGALKLILAERSKIFSRLRLADLATRTVPLSYVDAEAALFALRAMGYSVVTDSESMAEDDSYKGEDVDAFDLARLQPPAGQPAAPAQPTEAQAAFAAIPPDEQKRFLPRFPAIRNLPTTIALDRLPLVVRIPSTDKGNMGLVGGELTQSQRDALGLTIIPSAASPLAETVAGGSSELLVIYHPDYPEQLVKMRRLIRETIDRPARQVYVEGLVLEISQEGLKELGVQWDIKKGSQSFTLGSLIPVPPGGNALSIVRDSTLNVSPTQIAARVNALVQTNKAEVLSRPSIITLDNRQATIRVGTDIPVSTSQDAASAGSGSNRVAFSFQYIPTGILLNVRPRISDDLTEISMLIDATVSATVPGADLQVLDPVSRIALASAPTISTRRVQTYARILDNQPLIIGGLLSRNQIVTRSKVPLLGDLPFVGALFGYTSREDDRREVIIVLTPSIVTENIRETKAQYPKDDDRFDQLDTSIFKEHYRLRASDLVDSSDIRFNLRFRTYRDIANKVIERQPELATRAPFSQFAGNRVPAEFFFVAGMMHRMLDRNPNTHLSSIENFKFFERDGLAELRPVSVARALASRGDGKDPESFFTHNPGKALALTFRLARASIAAQDMFTETVPEVRVVDCPDRATWRQMLWDMSTPDERGVARYTILIQDASDIRRLQLAYATQNTVLNNGGIAGQVFDKWLVGRMLHMQEVQPTWERILNAQIAQYFFIGEHWYMHFIQEHQKAMQRLEAALKSPDIQPLLEGIKVP
jgi:general secretion pathway protein D